jgi:hypothetical protein
MTEILELPHLVQQHDMSKMQVRGGRIEARFDAQRPALLQPRRKIIFEEHLLRTTQQFGE